VIGSLYVEAPGALRYCNDDGFGTGTWGGIAGGAWMQVSDFLYPSDTASNPNLFLGIGTEDPYARFHVHNPSTQFRGVSHTNLDSEFILSDSISTMKILGEDALGGGGSVILSEVNGSGQLNDAWILGRNASNNDPAVSGEFFMAYQNDSSCCAQSDAEKRRLTILQDKKMGIGEILIPEAKFHLRNDDGITSLLLEDTSGISSHWELRSKMNGDFSFYGGEGLALDDRYVIKPNGNIGIGTSDPQAGLHITNDPFFSINASKGLFLSPVVQQASLRLADTDTGYWGAINGGSYSPSINDTRLAMHFFAYDEDGVVNIGTRYMAQRGKFNVGDLSNHSVLVDFGSIKIMSSGSATMGATLNIIGDNTGTTNAHILLSSAPSAGKNKHWSINHWGPSKNNNFSIGYQETNGTNFSLTAGINEYLTIETNGNVGMGAGRTNPNHPLHMESGAHVTAGGVWIDASSRDYKENISDLSLEEAREALHALEAVTFEYKNNLGKTEVGFIAEEVPAIVAKKDRDGLNAMDFTAVLSKIVQDHQKQIKFNQEQIDQQDSLLSELESKLNSL